MDNKTLKEQKILDFINGMTNVFREEVQFTFYRGYCYWFALILATRFKGAIWFNPKIVHFAARIDGVLYDVYGEINPGICPVDGKEDGSENDWCNWSVFQSLNPEAIESIVNSCIKKINPPNGG